MIAQSMPMRDRIPGSAVFLCAVLLLTGCDGPMTGGKDEKTDTSNNDSLDAELGKQKQNRYDFLQGNLVSTGQVMDLAIDGSGFFILKNKTRNVYFRRPASFTQDAEGYLNLGNVSTRLQGIQLYSAQVPYPNIEPDSFPQVKSGLPDLIDIKWPFNDLAPPRSTTEVKLARNLDSDAMGKGSILYSQRFLHHAVGSDIAIGLLNARGQELGIYENDVLMLSATNGASTQSVAVKIIPRFTLTDLAAAATAFLRSTEVGAGAGATVDLVSAADSEPLRGALTLYGNSAPIRNFQVTSNRPISGPLVARAFAVPTDIPAGSIRMAVTTETLRAPALATDPLSEIYDAAGNRLGLEAGDQITISGSIGGDPAVNVTPLTYVDGPAGTTLGAIVAKVQENFKLATRDGSIYNHYSVSLNPAGTADNIPDGSLLIRGQPGTASAIRDVAIRATDGNNGQPAPNFFNTGMNMTTLRDAVDNEAAQSSIYVYDESGKNHILVINIIPTNTPGQWLWEAGLNEMERILHGARGKLSFGADGSVSFFGNDEGDLRLEFDPMDGAKNVSLKLSAGGPGDFTGLTQFRSATTAALVGQDGLAAGKLMQISIDEAGIIYGAYSNGKTRALFQIPLADFPNRKGLSLIGENTFLETPDSGKPTVSSGLHDFPAAIKSGAIEYVTPAEFARVCEMYPECKAGR